MKEAIYNAIGKNYNQNRQADQRVINKILNNLPSSPHQLIADIGAGTGNYAYPIAKKGNKVHALEPSEVMQQQRKKHENIEWFTGYAEKIPFADNFYDSAICILATHHFSDLEKSLSEMYRILKHQGKLVIFTRDPRQVEPNCWLREYFSLLYENACQVYVEKEKLLNLTEKIFDSKAKIENFLLPFDLTDGFFYSAWQQPEKYLSEDFRKGISVFSLLPEEEVLQIIQGLQKSLAKGEWDKKYHSIRKQPTYNGGYYFLIIEK